MSTYEEFERDHVVAGTDGSAVGSCGVAVAAREAAARGVTLEIVHVLPGYLPVGPLPMVPDGALQSYAYEVVGRAAVEARAQAPGLEVRTTLTSGGRVDGLVAAGRHAALMVLGTHPPRGLSERIWTGATVTGVAARATCPLWVVPQGAHLDLGVRRIVVAVKSFDHARDLLVPAFAEASASGATLEIVHAWRLAGGYDDIITARVHPEEMNALLRETAFDVIEDLLAAYPDVACEVLVEHGQAATLLVRESAHADRLVIGRPVHGGSFHHLGATARALLRSSHCVVEVLPPPGPVPPAGETGRHRSLEMSGPAATS